MEYLVGAPGGLLVLALLDFLIHQALGARETGPEVAVVVTGVDEASAGWAVHVEVADSGGRTAEAVQISGAVLRDGRPIDQASSSIAHLPPHSSPEGVLVFSTDSGAGRLRVGVLGHPALRPGPSADGR